MCTDKDVMLDENDSVVGTIPDPFPEMFEAITSEKDANYRWTSLTLPIDVDMSHTSTTPDDIAKMKIQIGM